jgi:hypothetical protein
MAFATDVFVFGLGTPQDRRVTKVSGLPYWPKTRTWPMAKNGSPYQFLAQICFLDSRDLVGKLPGGLLLLFVPQGDEEWLWDLDRVHFEWLTAEDTQALITALPKGVEPYCRSEWYGVLHRTQDYPGVAEQARKLKVDQPYNLPILNASKIGGIAHAIQPKAKYGVNPSTGLPVLLPDNKGKAPARRFMCQLTSIQAAPDMPYPWTNQRKKLSLEFDETGIHGDDNQCLFGDMGSIYVFVEPSGKCVATSESY